LTVVANGCNKINLSNAVQEMVAGGIIVAAAFDQFRQPQATAK
jgi:ribose/xylose/arabinose/galactoside ABC-type transport system permease subunit